MTSNAFHSRSPCAPFVVAAILGGGAVAGSLAALAPVILAGLLALVLLALPLLGNSPWMRLAPLTVIVFTSAIADPAFTASAVTNGDTLQKTFLVGAILALMLALGVRANASATHVLLVAVSSFLLSQTIFTESTYVDFITALRGLSGIILPWLLLFVDWRPIGATNALRFVTLLPALCVLCGTILQVVGVTTVVSWNSSDLPRLQGSSIPAHLAMLCFAAVAAGLVLISNGHSRRNLRVLVLNILLLVGTLTRGAIAVSLLVVFVYFLRSVQSNSSLSRSARRSGFVVGTAAILIVIAAVPELIARSLGNSYEGAWNTSGRDAAWDFYIRLALEHPFTGRGMGFSAIANRQFQPTGVQAAFEAPHNEYIHFFLDGGLLLLVPLVLCFAFLFVSAGARAPKAVRPVIASLGAAMIIYSAVDNTFSTPQLTVPLAIVLGSIRYMQRTSTDTTAKRSASI